MRDLTSLLGLPASLLCTILIPAIDAQALQWPHNLPRTLKYYPEHEPQVKRDAEVQSRMAWQRPIGVKKMSDDGGQKFFLDYWGFEESEADSRGQTGQDSGFGNDTMADSLRPPIMPQTNHDRPRRHVLGRDLFVRDYDCPANTNSCASLGYSDLCCALGWGCVETSVGVGCCPEGQTCGDNISECNTTQGYTNCETDSNSGCCVPGAQCESGGCVFYGTQTIYTTLPTERVTTGVSTRIETSSGRPITVVFTTVQRSLSTTTETVTASPSGYTTTRTVVIVPAGSTSTPSTCATGFFSCPASLGGGCCPNGQECASDSLCPDSTSAAGAPILPTTATDTVGVATFTAVPTSTAYATDACPTGFYMCSARYLGGCCRVDRNCDTTSCPPQATTTVTSGDEATVAAATTGGESCANGWALCPAGQGGGCCPSGFSCGAQSCSASGQQDTQKMQPNYASRMGGVVLGSGLAILALGAGLGMVWL